MVNWAVGAKQVISKSRVKNGNSYHLLRPYDGITEISGTEMEMVNQFVISKIISV